MDEFNGWDGGGRDCSITQCIFRTGLIGK